MLGFTRKKEPDPVRDRAIEAMRKADEALADRAAGLRALMRELGVGVDKATEDLIDTLAGRKDT